MGPLAAPRFLVSVAFKGFSHVVSDLESIVTWIFASIDLKEVIEAERTCSREVGLAGQKNSGSRASALQNLTIPRHDHTRVCARKARQKSDIIVSY
jgi:hypothetical protein